MREEHAEIQTTTMFNLLVAPPVPVEVELGYSTKDPYAVTAVFNPGGSQSVEWILARDLLADGLISESGEGDVRMWPIPDQMDLVVVEFTTRPGTRGSPPTPRSWPTSSTAATRSWRRARSRGGSTSSTSSPTSATWAERCPPTAGAPPTGESAPLCRVKPGARSGEPPHASAR